MTNSRSIGSRSKLLAVVVAACALLGARGVADAGGRKRVVVLDFEGPKGDKFHDDLVKLIKKTHTVVPTDKWNGAAEQLDAGAVSDKNVKKVARKLKIDAIVEGKIEKRRDEFIIRLKLRAGRSGELFGDAIDTKADGPRIDGRAQRDLNDELLGAIDKVESNHLSGGDDGDDPPKRGKKTDDDDDDKLPARKPAAKKADADDDDRPARHGGFSRRSDDERGADKTDRRSKKADADDDDKPAARKPAAKQADADDDDKPVAKKPAAKKADADDDDKLPARKPVAKKAADDDDKPAAKKPAAKQVDADDDDKLPPKKTAARKSPAKKKVASRDDDDGSAEAEGAPLDAATARSPGERALEAVVGLSVTMRRMSFAVTPALRATPAGYKGIPVAGGTFDATFYPLAFGHSSTEQTKNIGVELLYDRVIKLSSQDPATKMTYSTVESRFALSAVFRHAFGTGPTAPVVLGSLGYQRQSFNILGPVDLPDVKYSMIPLGAGVRFPVTRKVVLSADAKLLIVTAAGQISDGDQYGDASVIGFEGALGGDYLITPNIFARAAVRAETIGFSFKGNGSQSNARDGDPTTQDVTGGRDTYFGGMLTVGYIY